MKLNELRNLVKEVIKEQQEGDFTQHTNRSVVSFFKLMLRNPFYQSDLAELYQTMLTQEMDARQDREAAAAAIVKKHSDLGNNDARRVFTPQMINFHRRGLFGASDVPKKDVLLAAAQAATQARKDAEAAAQAERNKIKVRDRGSFYKGRIYSLDATTEDEAKAEHWDLFQGQFPGPNTLYLDPEGNYFVHADYGNLGT